MTDLQLLVYALAYERMYGEPPVKVALHFLGTGERGEYAPQRDAVAAVGAQITSYARKIRERQFPAEPQKPEARTCRACPYSQICPESWTARAFVAPLGE